MKSYRCTRAFWFDDQLREKDEIILSTPEATEADLNAGNLVEEKEPATKKVRPKSQSTTKDKTEADK